MDQRTQSRHPYTSTCRSRIDVGWDISAIQLRPVERPILTRPALTAKPGKLAFLNKQFDGHTLRQSSLILFGFSKKLSSDPVRNPVLAHDVCGGPWLITDELGPGLRGTRAVMPSKQQDRLDCKLMGLGRWHSRTVLRGESAKAPQHPRSSSESHRFP